MGKNKKRVIVVKKKMSLIGDPGVGKTSLIRRYIYDEFDDSYLSTMGMKVSKKRLIAERPFGTVEVGLQVWDTMGQRHFKPLLMKYFEGSDGAFVVCDITMKASLANAKEWARLLLSVTDRIPLLFLANKTDLIEHAQFTPDDLTTLAKRYGNGFLPTSAKTGLNVENAFQQLTELMVDETGLENQ